jgi:hypothetical protein
VADGIREVVNETGDDGLEIRREEEESLLIVAGADDETVGMDVVKVSVSRHLLVLELDDIGLGFFGWEGWEFWPDPVDAEGASGSGGDAEGFPGFVAEAADKEKLGGLGRMFDDQNAKTEVLLEVVPVGEVVFEGVAGEERANVAEKGGEDVDHGATATAKDFGGGAQETAKCCVSWAVASWEEEVDVLCPRAGRGWFDIGVGAKGIVGREAGVLVQVPLLKGKSQTLVGEEFVVKLVVGDGWC